MQMNDPLYFLKVEFMETVSDQLFRTDQKKEFKPTYRYKTGAEYTGEWLGGFRHGIGTIQWRDGASYQGNWSEGKADGYGRLIFPNGDQYMGSFKNDKANGWGIMHRNDQDLGPIIFEG